MISMFGCASSVRSLSAGATAMNFLLSLLRRDAGRLDGRGEGFVVLLEDGLIPPLAEPARNDAELAQPLGNFGRLGKSRDLTPDRLDDRLRRADARRKAVPG